MPIIISSHTETGGGIRLRIAIDQQDFETLQRKARRKIDRGGRLTHSTLLINHPDNLSHGISG